MAKFDDDFPLNPQLAEVSHGSTQSAAFSQTGNNIVPEGRPVVRGQPEELRLALEAIQGLQIQMRDVSLLKGEPIGESLPYTSTDLANSSVCSRSRSGTEVGGRGRRRETEWALKAIQAHQMCLPNIPILAAEERRALPPEGADATLTDAGLDAEVHGNNQPSEVGIDAGAAESIKELLETDTTQFRGRRMAWSALECLSFLRCLEAHQDWTVSQYCSAHDLRFPKQNRSWRAITNQKRKLADQGIIAAQLEAAMIERGLSTDEPAEIEPADDTPPKLSQPRVKRGRRRKAY